MILRPMTPDDAPALEEFVHEDEVYRYLLDVEGVRTITVVHPPFCGRKLD